MAKVNIDLIANVKDAVKSVRKFSNQASDSITKVSDSFLNLKTLAAGALAGVGFGRIVQAAAQQEQAVQQLNTALALSGELSEENTQSFLDFASALQANSTVGDEVSLGLVGLAKSFGASNDQAKQILQTAADLSAVTGESLETSVRNLSKTLGGLKGELGETQPELRGLTKSQLENGEAITVLGQKYAGAAKALTKTFSGALTQTTNSFGDLLEEVGKFITSNPTVIAAINLAGEVFAEVGKIIDDNREQFADFISNGIGALVDLIPTAVRVLGKFIVGVQSIKLAFEGAKFGVALAAEGILRSLDFILEAIGDLIQKGLTPLTLGFQVAIEGLRIVGAISDESAASFKSAANNILEIGTNLGSVLDGAIDSVSEFGEEAGASFEDTRQSIIDTSETFEGIALETESYGTRLQILAEEANNSGDSLQRLSDSNKNLTQTTKQSSEEIDKQKASLQELSKGLDAIRADFQKSEDAANPIAAIERTEKERINILQKSLDAGKISRFEFNKLILKNETETAQKIADAQFKINKDNLDRINQSEEETRKKVQANISSGAIGLVTSGVEGISATIQNFFADEKNKIDVSALFGDSQAIAGQAAGATNQLLKGAEGARDLLVQGSALAADAFLPGLGQAVGPLVDALSQGPEFVKEQITAFAEAIPELLENIAAAIPVLIEVLADKAPEIIVALVKAAPAIAKAIIVSLARFPQLLVKEILVELAKGIDSIFGTTISTDFEAATEKFAGATQDLQTKYVSSVEDGTERILGGFQKGLNTFTSTFATFFESIGNGIATAIGDVGAQISQVFTDGFNDGAAALAAPFDSFSESIGSLGAVVGDFGSDFLSGFDTLIRDLFAFKFPSLPELDFPQIPELTFPDLTASLKAPINAIIDLFNSLKLPRVDVGGKVLGKSFGFTLIPDIDLIPGTIANLQSGGRVPEGFPDDSFRAGLTSGEEVIDTSTSEQLRDFLNEQQAGRDVNIVLQIGEKQLADVLLNINRQGFRVTP